jgi:hypothetical protein
MNSEVTFDGFPGLTETAVATIGAPLFTSASKPNCW